MDSNGNVIRDQNGIPVYPSSMVEDTWEMEYGAFNKLPAGTKASMLKSEQPGSNYETLINIELGSIGRPIGMPMFIVSLDARQANMSSAYVAMQPFGKRIRSERKRYTRLLNTRIWPQFICEAALAELLPGGVEIPDDPRQLPHLWTWDRVNDHADPAKVATAAQGRIDAGITSRRQEAADLALDLDEQDEMSAADFGISKEEYRDALFQAAMTKRGNVAPVAASPTPPKRQEVPPDDKVEEEEID
jgi:capsid protein